MRNRLFHIEYLDIVCTQVLLVGVMFNDSHYKTYKLRKSFVTADM